jgi:hypothetical protein
MAITDVMRSLKLFVGVGFAALLAALTVGPPVLRNIAAAQSRSGVLAPRFEVDPLWPKPLPNHWFLGSTIGVWVDTDDHVWIIHRSSATLAVNERPLEMKTGECCAGAPPVLEFDQAGNLLRHWGGPGQGYEWPDSNHGIFIDYKGNVWIGGNGGPDSQILKFTKDGKFLMQVGKKGARRKAGAAAGGKGDVAGFGKQQRCGKLWSRCKNLCRPKRERGLYRRRLPEQTRRGDRCRYRQDEAVVGRLRQQTRRHAAHRL